MLFSETNLLKIAKQFHNNKLPTTLPARASKMANRIQIVDDIVTGLRAVLSPTGGVALQAQYQVGKEFRQVKLGSLNRKDYITIENARAATKIIRALGELQIDILDHKDLLIELLDPSIRRTSRP